LIERPEEVFCMLTLKDIAQHVGVSASTVSLVLNDRDHGRVNVQVAARIRETAERMGYVPNLLARSLRTKQSRTIGMLSDGAASVPFASGMVKGAQEAAWSHGYLLMLIDTGRNRDLDLPAVQSLLQRNIEGFIFAAEFHRDVEVPLVPSSVPVVVLDGRAVGRDDVDAVVPDEAQGARDAVAYLVDAGHTRIGHLSISDPVYIAGRLRREGYERALREAGIAVEPTLVVEAPGVSTVSALAAARALLGRPDRPTAVFCFSDRLAFAVYHAAAELGLRVPDDVSVIGFDNQVDVAESLLPGLTSVSLPHVDMGRWAMERALRRLGRANGPPEFRLMECPLVFRDSVAPPAV
jgi:LacI family transcriptional regulator